MNRCLYCYGEIDGDKDYHQKCSLSFFGTVLAPKIEYSIDQMDELAKKVVERSVTVPGVQAKLSMSLFQKTKKENDSRLTIVDALGGNYIFKPPSEKFEEMPENEHLTMRIAELFGIQVVPSSLIRLTSGEISYITKRIDRTESGQKIHMLDMFQITEAFDKYRSSMERIGKAIHNFSDNILLDKIRYFELTLFSFLFGNNDMHLKNFSMIKSEIGWTLAPAYDLLNVAIIIPEDHEELALTLIGKKKKLKIEHFQSFGKELNLTEKQISSSFKRILKHQNNVGKLIDMSFLSEAMKTAYKNLIDNRYHQLELNRAY